MSQRFILGKRVGHGVFCAQPVSIRNQQAGPDPERPTGLHEMESERIYPAVHLVRERSENRLGPADQSRTPALPTSVRLRGLRTSVRPGAIGERTK